MMVCHATRKDISYGMQYHEDEFFRLALGYGLVKDENIPRFVNAYYAQWSSVMGVAGYLVQSLDNTDYLMSADKELKEEVPEGSAGISQQSGLS